MKPIYSMKGVQDLLEVYEDKVTITPKGILGLMNKGLKGTKTIPYASITALQFKKSGLTSGYIQFTLPGGNESRGGVFAATKDENSFMFTGQNKLAEEIKSYIESRIQQARNGGAVQKTGSLSQELERLAELKSKGILTDEEFLIAKKQLLK